MQMMYTFLFITNNNKSIENNNTMSIMKLKVESKVYEKLDE